MSAPLLRTEAAFALRRCLQLATLPTLATTLLAWLLATATQPVPTATPAALSGWLYVPQWVAATACAAALVRFAPLFALGAPGAAVALRFGRGPLQGVGAGIAAALLAQALLTVPLTTLLAIALRAPPAAHAMALLDAGPQPLLWPAAPKLPITAPPTSAVDRLVLQPIASLPAGPLQPSEVSVVVDGQVLTRLPVGFRGSHERAEVAFAPQQLRHLELVLSAGNVPLYFPPGTLAARCATAYGRLPNTVLAALLGLVPTFLALAIGALGGAIAGQATTLVLVLGIGAVMALGDYTGSRQACQAVLQGEWLGTAGYFQRSAPSLLTGCLAMIVAMMLRRSKRR
jgi:hypothetical protein